MGRIWLDESFVATLSIPQNSLSHLINLKPRQRIPQNKRLRNIIATDHVTLGVLEVLDYLDFSAEFGNIY